MSSLPLPTTVDQPWLSVHNAMEAGMQPSMDDEESLHFTAMVWWVLGMHPSLKKKATVGQLNAWHAQRLSAVLSCIKHA